MGKSRHTKLGLIFATLSILAITAAVGLACTPAKVLAAGAPAAIVAIPTTTPQSAAWSGGYYGRRDFDSPLEARVLDASGNPVSGVTVTLTAPSDGPTVGLGTETKTTDANGIATSDNVGGNDINGSFEVTASAPGVSTPAVFELTNASSTPYTVTAAASFPDTAQPNTPFVPDLQVTVTDGNNNPISGVDVTFTAYTAEDSGFAGEASALFAGNQASVDVTTNVLGVATAPTLTASGVLGTYVVTASTPSGYVPAWWQLTNSDQSPRTIVAIPTTTPQSAAWSGGYYGSYGFASPLEARVLDANGNPVSGVTVTFTAPSNGPTLSFGTETKTTGANGIATSDSPGGINGTGSFEVSADAAGVVSSAVFELTNASSSPYTVTAATASTPQTAPVSTQFASSLAVTVTDLNNVPVSDVQVTFAAFTASESGNAGSATGIFAGGQQSVTEVTDVNGQAVAPAFTANSVTGSYVATAWTADGYQPAMFQLSNAFGDTTPPTTIVSGADTNWHNSAVTLTFTATDNSGGSGVDYTQYSTNGGTTWTKGTTVTISTAGTTTVKYRSTDKAGNTETAKSCTVRIDTGVPATTAKAATVKRNKKVTFKFSVTDPAPSCGSAKVTIQIKKGTKVVKTLKVGVKGTNTPLSYKWKAALKKGSYTYRVLATDVAGNKATTIGSAKLTVT